MRKLFLTSGLVLCMVGSALAATDIDTTGSNASCVNNTLDTYSGSTSFQAKWNANISGSITLNSDRWASSGAESAIQTATTVAAPTPLFSVYGKGMYSSSSEASARSNNTISALTTAPAMTGYDFQGFYTGKAGSGTKVINADKTFASGAENVISSTGGQATWYAHWAAKVLNLTYTCGTAPTVTGLTIATTGEAPAATTATYDGSKAIASTPNACALTGDRGGYHFSGWSCSVDPDDNAGTATYNASYSNNAWSVSKTVNPWKATTDVTCDALWAGNTYTISYATGTAGARTDGFNGSMTGTSVTFGSNQTITSNAFSIPGYTFTGWNGNYDNSTGSEATTSYSNGYTFSPYKIAHNLTLTAQWRPNVYTITLKNYNDTGTHGTIYEKYDTGWYSDSAAISSLSNATPPTRSGFQFRGFYTSTQTDLTANGSSGTQRISKTGVLPANSTFTGDTSLYAAWATECAAGTGCTCTLGITDAGAVTYTTGASAGYTLSSGDGTYNPTCTANVYKLTLNDNNGSGGNGAVYEKYANGWSLTDFGTTITQLTQTPTRSGFKFRGYYDATVTDITANGNTGTQVITKDLTLPSNTTYTAATTLYAAWATDCAPGTGCNCTLEIANNGAVTYSTSAKTGYSLNSGSSGKYNPACTPNTYTISLKNKDGTATDSTIYEKYATGWYSDSGATSTLANATTPSRSGYTFRGYYAEQLADLTSNGGSGTLYVKKNGVLPSNTAFSENTSLYAAWATNCTKPSYNNATVGDCGVTIGDDGKATYTASCDTGFTVGNATTSTPSCTPNVYAIILNDNNGTGGSGTIYEKYATNWYTTAEATATLSNAAVPTRTGYKFRGYYSEQQADLSSTGGSGTRKIDASGGLPGPSTYTDGTTLYAAWAKECTQPAHGSCTTTVNSNGTVTYAATCDTGYSVVNGSTATPSCSANCNKITFDANTGTLGSVTVLYKKTAATGWYSDSICTTGWTSDVNVVPTLSGASFRGFYVSEIGMVTGDTSTNTPYINKNGATTAEGTALTVNAPTTIYAAWAKNCTSPANGTCSLDVSDAGVVDYTTTCSTGYTISGNNTATPSCGANCNAITLNANEGTANTVTTLYKKTDATGWYSDSSCSSQWTSGANVVPSRSNFTFRGFYSADLDDVTSDNSGGTQYLTTAGATNTAGTNWTVNAPKTIYAAWAKNCTTPTNGTCTLNVSTAGAADYATSCTSAGYTLNGNNSATPTCTANRYTVTYVCGGKPGSESLTCSGASGCTAAGPASTEFTFASDYTLPNNAGTCQYKGWSFDGWKCNHDLGNGGAVANYTSTNSNGSAFASGATGTYNVIGNVECKAKWKANNIGLSWNIGANATPGSTPGGTSCDYDGAITIPAAPTRTGYTFAGWTVQPCLNDYACGLSSSLTATDGGTIGYYNYNQSEYSNQNVSTYSLSSGEWATSFSHGTVKGLAACSNTGANVYDNSVYKSLPSEGAQEDAVWAACDSDAFKPSNTFSSSNSSGSHCWCKVTSYTATGGSACSAGSQWVLAQTWESGAAHCPSQCAKVCAEAVRDRSVFRTALFGTTGQ